MRSWATRTACSNFSYAEERTLLGVHAFGSNAAELVHIGRTVMGLGGTIDYLVDTVFNYPTLAKGYKVAALDAVNKMRAIERSDEGSSENSMLGRAPALTCCCP